MTGRAAATTDGIGGNAFEAARMLAWLAGALEGEAVDQVGSGG